MKMTFGLTRIYLTEKGEKTRDMILEKLISFVNTLLSDFTPKDKENFRRLILKASNKFHEL